MTEIIKDRNLNAHISTAYEQELLSLRDKTLEMAGIVESHYTKAIDALNMQDTKAAEEISKNDSTYGAMNLFKNSFNEYNSSKPDKHITEIDLESINRSMRVSIASDEEEMNKHLPFLANVGSVSPYVGLLGTVWGIMTSFQGLSDATQATINAVAPGISEALVATGMGLFAAIPAVIGYNRFSANVDVLMKRYEGFCDEVTAILHRAAHARPNTSDGA